VKRIRITVLAVIALLVLAIAVPALAGTTIVPGHDQERWDSDDNGYPDVGVTTNGKYTSVYAYDCDPDCATGDWFWDLGDGRTQGSVSGFDQLDPSTLTTCVYQVVYRGNFENDPYLDSGWILNTINCSGYDDNNQYNYLIVHNTDPRWTGNGIDVGWGPEWEAVVYTISHYGNLAKPHGPAGS